MNKLMHIFTLLAIAVVCYGGQYPLNAQASQLLVTPTNATDFRIDINIGDFTYENGVVALPTQLQAYSTNKKALPELSFHIALPEFGEYEWQANRLESETELSTSNLEQTQSEQIKISKPYKLRDIAGIEVTFSPFKQRDGKLVVTDKVSIELVRVDKGPQGKVTSPPRKLNPYFVDIYKQHFINFEYRYEDVAEYGSMAVISPTTSFDIQVQQFRGLIQPWVDWKNQKGIPTTVYSINDAGDTYEEIRAFIQNLYDNDPNLTFVQLVGDFEQVPCLVTTMHGNTGGMDAFYTLLEGDDYYPDIFIGRFSAETAADLYTQIKRSIEYEKNPLEGEWLSRAAGVCSDNPPIPGDDDEHNWEHLDNIRTDLLDYGYTSVERIYANEGASLQNLIDCLNEGKSLINYCGEGYPTHWVNPPFSVTDTQNLTNTGMLPFIHVVSCWTGQFYDGTCLAEAFMRSRDVTVEEARGAIAVYAAAPEQGVDMPMESQDHAMELLVSGTKNTIGGLCYNGSSSMIDEYGDAGVYNFLAWNLFGDASLVLRTKPAEDIDAVLPNEIPNSNYLIIDAGSPDILVSLSQDNVFVTSSFSNSNGIANLSYQPAVGDRYLLTLSGFNRKPLSHTLECFNSGMHAILDLTILDSDQFIEPETEIFKTVRVTNRGQVASDDVTISLWQSYLSYNLVPVIAFQNIRQILPGETKETTLSFRIHKGTQDLSTVNYSIWVNNNLYHFSDVVHAPTLVVESVTRSPQINWINPGDTYSLNYVIKNEGSAVARELRGELETRYDYSEIIEQGDAYLTIASGSTGTMTFETIVPPSCQSGNTIYTDLRLEALNAIGGTSNPWLITAPGITVESFESHDMQAFPWQYQADQWSFRSSFYDGDYSIQSRGINADTITLQISFISLQTGVLSFHYNLNNFLDLDRWQVTVNQSESYALENYEMIQWIELNEGFNTVKWVGTVNNCSDCFNSWLVLDAIRFPAKTVFINAQLAADVTHLDITLAPGEIREIPLTLTSLDGKYIHYDAVIQKQGGKKDKSEDLRLTCNRAAFTPGTSEMFLFSLNNSSPAQAIKQISIGLPEKVLSTSASAFSMPGQTSLPFSGNLGSFTELLWESSAGSMADSLRAGVRMVFDAGYSRIVMPYSIISENTFGESIHTFGEIELLSTENIHECLSLISGEGEVRDEESSSLVLRANQNLLGAEPEGYNLIIFYNGMQQLTIPVTVSYDENPPGFYETLHLSNYPNPIKENTTFAYGVPQDGPTTLTIYNIRGQKVRTLLSGEVSKGFYRTLWMLDNDIGTRVGNGIYFCRLISPSGKEKTIKCAVVK